MLMGPARCSSMPRGSRCAHNHPVYVRTSHNTTTCKFCLLRDRSAEQSRWSKQHQQHRKRSRNLKFHLLRDDDFSCDDFIPSDDDNCGDDQNHDPQDQDKENEGGPGADALFCVATAEDPNEDESFCDGSDSWEALSSVESVVSLESSTPVSLAKQVDKGGSQPSYRDTLILGAAGSSDSKQTPMATLTTHTNTKHKERPATNPGAEKSTDERPTGAWWEEDSYDFDFFRDGVKGARGGRAGSMFSGNSKSTKNVDRLSGKSLSRRGRKAAAWRSGLTRCYWY